jgi:ubiquinone/menaquinone biosynthesis C-methylase UbiE
MATGQQIRPASATRDQVRRYFESDRDAVSSPLSAFGVLTSYGHDFLARYAECIRGQRVLDAGAGLGVVAAEMARAYGAFVVALDYADWVHTIPTCAHPVQGELLQLPLADGTMDAVVCFEVLEHTLDPVQAIAEMWRVLRPGGSLLLSTPSYLNAAGALKVLLEGVGIYGKDTFAPFDEWKPKVLERRITATWMQRTLRRQGFLIARVEGAEIFDAWIPFANRIPGLFQSARFLKLRAWVDRSASWPVLRWLSLHGIFHAVRPGDTCSRISDARRVGGAGIRARSHSAAMFR